MRKSYRNNKKLPGWQFFVGFFFYKILEYLKLAIVP